MLDWYNQGGEVEGSNSNNNGDNDTSPLFSLRKLDWNGLASNTKGIRRNGKVIVNMAASNNTLILSTSDCSIVRWNLDGNNEAETIEISPRGEDVIEHIFLDPNGHHCLITLTNSDNFYLHNRSQRAKKLSKLQGSIQSVAFDRHSSVESVIKSFLVGTSSGFIYELSLDSGGKEKVCTMIYKLDQPLAITSLHFELVGGNETNSLNSINNSTTLPSDNVGSRIFVMCATSSPTRLYHFLGGPTFTALFAEITQNGTTSFTELPGEIKRAELHLYSKNLQQHAQNFALMTQMGIYHGTLLFSNLNQNRTENVLMEAQLMPYANHVSSNSHSDDTNSLDDVMTQALSNPISIANTEFHFLTLSNDRLRALSRVNGSLEQDNDILRVVDGTPIGLIRDDVKECLWLYTDSNVYQIVSINESRRLWLIYLDKALSSDERYFETSLEYCQKKEDQMTVRRLQAEHFLTKGQFDDAARHFAKAGLPFDEVILRLLKITPAADNGYTNLSTTTKTSQKIDLTDGPELFAVRVYLQEQLIALKSSSKSQRTMLCTWLSELFLHQITCAGLRIGTKNIVNSPTQTQLISQFKDFLRSNRNSLDHSTTFALLSSRGTSIHRSLVLFFSQIIGNYDIVISQYISEKRIVDAISILSDASHEKVEALIYKTAPILIVIEPELTVNMLLTKSRLQPAGLLPAFLRYATVLDQQIKRNKEKKDRSKGNKSLGNILGIDKKVILSEEDERLLNVDFEGNTTNFAVKYFQLYIAKNQAAGVAVEPSMYHSLVWFLVKYDDVDESGLMDLLQPICDSILDENPTFPTIDFNHILRQCQQFKRQKSIVLIYMMMGFDQQALNTALGFNIELAKKLAAKPYNDNKKKNLWLLIAKHIINTDKNAKRVLSLLSESNGILRIEDLMTHLPDFTEIDLFKEEICQTLEDCGSRIDHLKQEMNELSTSAESIINELESMKKRGYSLSSKQRCEYCSDSIFSKQFYIFPCSHGFHSSCILKRAHLHVDKEELDYIKGLQEQISICATRANDAADKKAVLQYEYLQAELDGCIAADCPLCGYVMIRSLNTPLITDNIEEINSWSL